MICEGQQVSQGVLIWLSQARHAFLLSAKLSSLSFCGMSSQQFHDVEDSSTWIRSHHHPRQVGLHSDMHVEQCGTNQHLVMPDFIVISCPTSTAAD